MNATVRIGAVALLAAAGVGLGGCVYYPVRTGVAYTDNQAVDYNDSVPYSRPAYYAYDADPYWYGPAWYGYGYGWPAISLGFYGGGYWGGHHYRGPWRGGYSHGGWSGGHGGGRSVAPPSRGGRHH